MDKPLVIRLNEVKTELVYVINNALQQNNLPCYLIEPMLAELLAQVKDGARNELQMAREQMKQNEQEEG